jgi:putative membrane protein
MFLKSEVIHIDSVYRQLCWIEGARVPDAETKLAVDRTHLAYDRTMLSWIRTATALITFGFSIHQFFRIARKGTVERTGFIGPHEFGMLMIVIGLLALLLATLEHRSAIHALQTQYPETKPYAHIHRSLAVVLAALVSVLGLLTLLSTFVQ